jgi:hypothetical protein
VVAGPNLAAQGVTTYNPRPVSDFQMEVVGTPQRILDSVLPHEVTHTVLATHFGRPLPRWADEGICTTVEHSSERSKHEAKLREFLASRRGIAMNRLFLLTEYPQDVLPMYAQGYSVCRFLIEQQGPRTFIQFLGDYMRRPSWTQNVRKHYGYESLLELQNSWLAWVKAGSGDVTKFAKLKSRPDATLAVANTDSPAKVLPAVAKTDSPDRASATLASGTNKAASLASLALGSPRGQWQPNDAGPVQPAKAAAAAAQPQQPEKFSADPQALADAGKGWYSRLRQEHAEQSGGRVAQEHIAQATVGNAAGEPIMPPSVRDSGTYSAAQPQAEQQWSRSNIAGGAGYGGSKWR